jgi:hypothetical protein
LSEEIIKQENKENKTQAQPDFKVFANESIVLRRELD